MQDQITALCRTVHFHLRNIGRIRKSITDDACEKLIHAFVTTCLDCGNANLYSLPDNQLNCVQHMFNIAARILTLTAKSDHITPVLRQLHWLPISQRIAYKILLLTFKALYGLAPQYISKLIKLQVTDRSTRQTDTNRLHQPVMRAPTFGDRDFVSAALNLWNRLPASVGKIEKLASFKKEIKTFLFKTAKVTDGLLVIAGVSVP